MSNYSGYIDYGYYPSGGGSYTITYPINYITTNSTFYGANPTTTQWVYKVNGPVGPSETSAEELKTKESKSELALKIVGNRDYLIALRDSIDEILENEKTKASSRFQDSDGIKRVTVELHD